eukprot:TRINITY_DN2919_c0_g2_i2.p1 TRINITY_DN2919_c0_g2~~TRINITY_DN2919_c0_g2_i2.p1  ORF type:complete len:407 (+),score=28.35 TRINITY_DN2919_c0_g2_i2:43-1221(+)
MEPPAVTLNTPLTPVGSASPTTVVGAARGGARGGRGNRGRGDPVRRAHGRGVGRGRGASNKPSPQSKLPRYGFHCTLENHKQPVTSLKFSPDGLWLASASADKTIAIWNTETWIRAQVLTGHSKGISDIEWARPTSGLTGLHLVSASDDKTVIIWDITLSEVSHKTLLGHKSYVSCVTWGDHVIISGGYDSKVIVWSPEGKVLKIESEAHTGPISAVKISEDNKTFFTTSYDGTCKMWCGETYQVLKTLMASSYPATSITFASHKSHMLLIANLDSTLRLYDTTAEEPIKREFRGHTNTQYTIGGRLISASEEKFLIHASEDGCFYQWVGSTPCSKVLAHEGDVVLCLEVSPRINHVVTSSLRGHNIKVWMAQPPLISQPLPAAGQSSTSMN